MYHKTNEFLPSAAGLLSRMPDYNLFRVIFSGNNHYSNTGQVTENNVIFKNRMLFFVQPVVYFFCFFSLFEIRKNTFFYLKNCKMNDERGIFSVFYCFSGNSITARSLIITLRFEYTKLFLAGKTIENVTDSSVDANTRRFS